MRPQTIGRVLGVGVRVAGRFVGQQLAGPAPSGGSASPAQAAQPVATGAQTRATVQNAGRVATQTGRSVSKGIGGFLRPFRRVGGILWLEVTGVFFLLPVIVFGPNLWRYRASWLHGPDHRAIIISAIIVVVFLYLGVSSFWRAQHR
jgi:hypothetical protein